MRERQCWWNEGHGVGFAVVDDTMNGNVLGTLKLVGAVVCASAGIGILVEGLGGKILGIIACCCDEVTLVDDGRA